MITRILAPVLNPVIHALMPTDRDHRRYNPRGITTYNPRGRGHDRGLWSPNPSPTSILLGVGLAAAAAIGGYALHKKYMSGDPNRIIPPVDPKLPAYVKAGATLGESQSVIDDIQQPIYLATYDAPDPDEFSALVPAVHVLTNTTITPLNRAIFGLDPETLTQPRDNSWTGWDMAGQKLTGQKSPKAIALLVTDVTGDFAQNAYEYVLAAINQSESSWETDEVRDTTIANILSNIAPEIDWSQGLQPYVATSDAYTLWSAVLLIGQVAYQNLVNKASVGPEGSVGPQPPGFIPPAPGPLVFSPY